MVDERELSLEECVRQQVELEKTMQERFSHHLAFLSIDVVDSTKLKAGVAEADLLYTFSEYHNIVKQKVSTVGGKIISTSGDGIMVEFTSEQFSVNAAIDILESLADFNRDRNLLGKPIVLRMGINAGQVLADDKHRDGKVFSVAIDIAGHLQKLAKPGQVLISKQVLLKIENKDDFAEYPGDFPVEVYRYKHSLDTAAAQAVQLEVKLVIDPIKGRSVSDLQAGEEIFVYFSAKNEGNKKYMESLGIDGDKKKRASIKAQVIEVSRTDAGSYKVLVQFRPDLYGIDIVGTNQRVRVVPRPEMAKPEVKEENWFAAILGFFRNMFR